MHVFRLVYPAGRRMTMVELQTWKSLLEVSKLLPNCANPRAALFCKTFGCSSPRLGSPAPMRCPMTRVEGLRWWEGRRSLSQMRLLELSAKRRSRDASRTWRSRPEVCANCRPAQCWLTALMMKSQGSADGDVGLTACLKAYSLT